MSEPHTPTKFQAVIVFVITLLLTIGIIVWVFFLNKGTATFTGAFPFYVRIGDLSQNCPAAPCTISIKPGTYTARFTKEGHFDQTKKMTISLWKNVSQEIAFNKVPYVKKTTQALSKDASSHFSLTTTKDEQPLIKNSTRQLVVKFKPLLVNPTMVESADDRYVLITENTKNTRINYLIDTTAKTRNRLDTMSSWRASHITAHYIVFEDESAMNGERAVLMDIATGALTKLKAISADTVTESPDGSIYFISPSHVDSDNKSLGISINEAIDLAALASSGESTPPLTFYIVHYDVSQKTFDTLTSLDTAQGKKPTKLRYPSVESGMTFEYNGTVWMVVIE